MKELMVIEKLKSLQKSLNCYSSTSTNAKSPKPIKISPASTTNTTTIKTTTHLQEYITFGNNNVKVHEERIEQGERAVKLTATRKGPGRRPKATGFDPGRGAETHSIHTE